MTAGTCTPWATIADMTGPCADYAMDTAALEDWLQVASDHLYNLTNRQWPGRCQRTERPCGGGGCYAGLPLAPNTPLSLIGALRASPWPYRDDRPTCGCSALSSVRLDAEPVVEILEVKVDGEVVPADEYRIDNGRYLTGLLVAGGGRRFWPACQMLELADTEDSTWSVTYAYGAEPPLGGIKAAAVLACQLALSADPAALRDGRCRLPKRVTTISRQGVTLAILDTFSVFADGLTGIPEVDLWISTVRYGETHRRATMSDPTKLRRWTRFGR